MLYWDFFSVPGWHAEIESFKFIRTVIHLTATQINLTLLIHLTVMNC